MPDTSLRIISYNVNGIRAAIGKGFIEWLKTDPADIICLQETKASKENIDCSLLAGLGLEHYWYSAQKKGYSGVAVFSKRKPDNVIYGNGHKVSDDEGRILQLDFGDIRVINAYFPSGTSGDLRQAFKYEWLDEFYLFLEELKTTKPNIILCGDYNIAHSEIDIHDPKGNKKNSGFLPAERAWMDKFFSTGFTDSFRHFVKDPHHYSWWSRRFPTVRERNKGWRMDYINVTNTLVPSLVSARILPDVKHSDHCPVFVELKSKT
jgi:exodeoxyribonuclease III